MKQRILTVFAALVSIGLFVELSPPSLQKTELAWINWDSLPGRNSFYFKKRQWLADARTIAAGVRYLYEYRTAAQTQTMDVVKAPYLSPARLEISTNHLGINGTASSSPLADVRSAKAGQVVGPIQLLTFVGLPPNSRFPNFSPLAPVVWHGSVWRQSVFGPFSEHTDASHSQASST